MPNCCTLGMGNSKLFILPSSEFSRSKWDIDSQKKRSSDLIVVNPVVLSAWAFKQPWHKFPSLPSPYGVRERLNATHLRVVGYKTTDILSALQWLDF